MHLRELDANLIVVLDALLIDASVTKAAERLGRSPSAVSHALANLREIFADELLVRTGQRLTPTAKALQLAPTVHVIVAGIEGLLRPTAPFDARSQVRSFTLICRDATELTLLGTLHAALKEKAPGIAVHRRALDGRQFLEDLRGGRAHFVIADGQPADTAADISWAPLFDEPYVTVARRGHPLAKGKPSRAAFFATPHIFVVRTHDSADPVREHFAGLGATPASATEVTSPFVGLFAVLQSDSVITVPEPLAKMATATLPLAAVPQPFKPLVIRNHLGWHRSQDRDECHEWLRDLIREAAAAAAQ